MWENVIEAEHLILTGICRRPTQTSVAPVNCSLSVSQNSSTSLAQHSRAASQMTTRLSSGASLTNYSPTMWPGMNSAVARWVERYSQSREPVVESDSRQGHLVEEASTCRQFCLMVTLLVKCHFRSVMLKKSGLKRRLDVKFV